MNIRKTSLLASLVIAMLAAAIFVIHDVQAAPQVGVPVQVTQPDGSLLDIYATGDEYYNWLHDAEGYTIIQDPDTGWYVYAGLADGRLYPTKYIAGSIHPAAAGLTPHLNASPEVISQITSAARAWQTEGAGVMEAAPTTGTINNVVVFIHFSDQTEFTTNTAAINAEFNSTAAGYDSLRNYYSEVSYNQLTISTGFYPTPGATIISYADPHPRTYYQAYNVVTNPGGYNGDAERTLREHTLLRDAVNYVNGLGQFPSGASLDGDGDGYVDSITFIVRGTSDGWAELLWPHAWSLYSYTVTIDGKRVYGYSFHLETSAFNSVLAHEMFHVLGAPDLYHYSGQGDTSLTPVGYWDVMEWNLDPPQHMGCYMKFKYGEWIPSIPQITTAGTYSLNPLTSSSNNCYLIGSPYSGTEFFILEFRKAGTSTFEASLPADGLLVYRINTTQNGNHDGPPDEVYVYRPNGTTSVDGDIVNAYFTSSVGRTAINDSTNPSSFLTDGSAGGLDICSIGSAAGSTISFTYGSCPGATPPSAFSKTTPTSGQTGISSMPTLDWEAATGASPMSTALTQPAMTAVTAPGPTPAPPAKPP